MGLFDGVLEELAKKLGHEIKQPEFIYTCKKHGEVKQFKADACEICEREQKSIVEQREIRFNHRIEHIPQQYRLSYNVHDAQSHNARKICGDFYKMMAARKYATLMLCGRHGGGKTHLACALAISFMRELDLTAKIMTAKQILSYVKLAYGRNDDYLTEAGQIANLVRYDLLLIDEIDAIAWTEKDKELLTEVISERYANRKPIVAISNRSFEDLSSFLGERIMSRLSENQHVAVFDGADYRKRNN